MLLISGPLTSCVTVQYLTNLEQQIDEWKRKISHFNDVIKFKLDIKKYNAPQYHKATDQD